MIYQTIKCFQTTIKIEKGLNKFKSLGLRISTWCANV